MRETSTLDCINLMLFSSETQLFYRKNTGVWFHKPNEWLLRGEKQFSPCFLFIFFTLDSGCHLIQKKKKTTIQLLKTNKQSFYYCRWTSELTPLLYNQINHSDSSEREKKMKFRAGLGSRGPPFSAAVRLIHTSRQQVVHITQLDL